MRSLIIPAMIFFFAGASFAQAQNATVTDPETGGEVTLTRAHWNANVDIANRDLVCQWYTFDARTGQNRQMQFSLTFRHNALTTGSPALNSTLIKENGVSTSTVWALGSKTRAWGVSDGVYSGPMPLSLSPFVETIAHNSNEINAVRIWDERFGSFICFDASGDAFLPSGSAGTGNTDLVSPVNFTFEFPSSTPASIPELYSLSTGEKVELVRGVWNYSDIANTKVSCFAKGWDGQAYVGQPDSAVSLFMPYNGGDSVVVSSKGQDIAAWLVDDMPVSNVQLPTGRAVTAEFMELTDTGYRMWSNSNNEFYECSAGKLINTDGDTSNTPLTISPASIIPLEAGACDYSDAARYGGWGWNPVSSTSCVPRETSVDNCDYSNASAHNGWGWDNVRQVSCEPLQDAECIDTDGDGWGWDGTNSCLVTIVAECIDTDGDGWGWDGTASCIP